MCWWALMVSLVLFGSSGENEGLLIDFEWAFAPLEGEKDMITQRKLFAILLFCTMLLSSTALVFGQEKRGMIESRGERIGPGPETQIPGDNIAFVGSEMGFSSDGKVVKGAPYSGQAVTEITQTLGDGNRIVNRSTASVYRDKEGRTRREQTITAIGPLAGQMPAAIFISDPVAGVSYILEPNSHIARKMTPMRFEFKLNTDGEKPIRDGKREIPAGPPEAGTFQVGVAGGSPSPVTIAGGGPGPLTIAGGGAGPVGVAGGSPGPGITIELQNFQVNGGKEESLGKQTIEGIEAEGARTTITIPAGEIGNERPIEIISERWYSPELQTVLITKHSDPRFGETVYRLTNISRTEPDASLFQVPADYKIKDAPPLPGPMRLRLPNEQ
jgi:hypothetical protein